MPLEAPVTRMVLPVSSNMRASHCAGSKRCKHALAYTQFASWRQPVDMSTDTIAVIGSGSIGTSWAIVFAGAGRAVRVHDIARDRLEAAERVLLARLEELAGFGLLNEPSDVIAGRVSFTTDLAAAVDGAVHVQESIPEDRDAKLEVLA